MADAKIPEAEDSAEKAYAAASEVLTAKPDASKKEESGVEAEAAPEEPAAAAPVELDATPVEFPAKAKRERKPRPAAKPAVAAPAPIPPPVAKAAPSKPATAKAKPVSKAPISKAKVVKAKAKAKPTRKPVASTLAPKPAKIAVSNSRKTPTILQLKDKIMATTTKTPDFTKSIQDAIADAQGKAKVAFEKGTSSLSEISEFTKGNVEALVESGKILAAGAQDLGSTYVADSRAAFETLTADVKELASAKNPTDFVKLQGDLLRRNFDAAVAAGSKNSEAMLKLVNEAFAPITGRFSLAMDKVKKAA